MNLLLPSIQHSHYFFFQETMQNKTIGNQILINHGLYYSWHFYWISVGALIGFIILFYIAFGIALAYRKRKFTTESAMDTTIIFICFKKEIMLLPVSAIVAYHGSIPRKFFAKVQEKEINIQKESTDHANMTQEGNPINHHPASPPPR